MSEYDEEDRKLFVGGLAHQATQDDLKEYFGKYGELESVKLKTDSMTGRSRGFAFILFQTPEGLEAATAEASHSIKGRTSTVKKADVKPGKIYVGKLPNSGVEKDDVQEHFEQYGTVTEVIRPIDRSKNNEPKNFCFVTFDKERVAKKLIEQGTCIIKGNSMQIKEATANSRDPAMRGGRGGYGGEQGNYGRGGGYGGGQGGYGGDQGGYGGGQGGYGGGQGGGYGGGRGGGGGGGFSGSPWMQDSYGGGWDGGNSGGGYGGQGDYGGGMGGGQGGYGGGMGGYGGGQGGYGGGGMGGGQGGYGGGQQGSFGGGGMGGGYGGGGKMRGGQRGGGRGEGRGRGGGRGAPY